MCGIAGIWNPAGVDPSPLPGMLDALTHRGPDGHGSRSLGPAGRPWVAMGARRLAIVDPDGGSQPMEDPQRRVLLTMNGEVYNHDRLRREVEAWGETIRTRSDTEVATLLVAQLGVEAALPRLDGMFSLAIADQRRREVHLVRDRMGVKPLYWTRTAAGSVVWGSEARALLRHPDVQAALNPEALQHYLMFEYVPAPGSMWRGIHKLEPGHRLVLSEEGIQQVRWWKAPLPVDGEGGDLHLWSRSLRGSLGVATRRRMAADVPVAFLLSGGIDSSAVAALGAEFQEEPLHTWSVAVDAPGFDEGAAARRVAAALGTVHRELRLGPDDLPGLLDRIAAHVDEPLADSSLPATWHLMAALAADGLRCVLSGDGADESFAGYPTTVAHRAAARLDRLHLSGALAAPFGRLAARLPVTHGVVSRDYKARRFVDGLPYPWARRNQVWLGAWLPDEVGATDSTWALVDAIGAEAAGVRDPANRAMVLDQRLYLAEGVLAKVDRASMAHGVEVRSPFLDHHVVELAADVPIGHKLQGRRDKVALREAFRGTLPDATVDRQKQGFGTPVGPWLRGPLRHLLEGLPEQVEGLIDADRLRVCIGEHIDGTQDHRRRLWSAVVLARWRRGPWGCG